ncbi:MAG: LysM peptidoglycan-binding domain-containing protein [Rickettsiales bacterium]|jgi:nucleoid-associated protein YgaU|nr:LysM peptidoglycan-binding domain-containing protein [Rickettsiales bacterium]
MLGKKKKRYANMGQLKKSNKVVRGAVARQSKWKSERRAFANRFWRSVNFFAKPKNGLNPALKKNQKQSCILRVVREYWFPILCAVAVIVMAIYTLAIPRCNIVATPAVPEPIIMPVRNAADVAPSVPTEIPTFDMVRIEQSGNIMVAGRWKANSAVSIKLNKKIIATERANENGEFVYVGTRPLKSGNYTIRLIGADENIDSENNVFVYISPRGTKNSMSLLMTADGSKFLQRPSLRSGELSVDKIDYLDSGRLVVTGHGIPRTRVTLTLDNQPLGNGIVSDHHAYGVGANVGELVAGRAYTLRVRMHDGNGRRAGVIKYEFVMPEPSNDTFYSVRRGDALWIIARNFLGRGAIYTMIAETNNIKNPNLIFPKQKLKIPARGK